MLYVVSFVLMFALSILLQEAEPQLPSAFLAFVPLIVVGINWIVAMTPLGASFGKRNITAATSAVLAPIAMLMLGIHLPSWPTWGGDVLLWFAGVQTFVLGMFGAWLQVWKLQQVLYDLLKRQAGTPDAIAAMLARA